MINKCLYLRFRTHKGIKYLYCTKQGCKGQIKAEKCHVCEFKEYKKQKSIKKVFRKEV